MINKLIVILKTKFSRVALKAVGCELVVGRKVVRRQPAVDGGGERAVVGRYAYSAVAAREQIPTCGPFVCSSRLKTMEGSVDKHPLGTLLPIG